ncbi:hypothetical protein GA0115239_12721, partial [Streptomyces sp. BpilaLS-43]
DRARTLDALGRRAQARASARTAAARFAAKGHLPGVRRAARCVPEEPVPEGNALTTRERS